MKSRVLDKLKHGSDDVLIELYKLYRNEFIHWAFINYNVPSDDAKDLFQESIIAFYDNVKSGRLKELSSDVKTYIFQIGKFKILNFLKKHNRRVTYSDFDVLKVVEPTENTMEDKAEQEFIKATVRKFLDEQCEDCKKVLELYYFNEMDMKSIAKEMGYKNADVAKKKKYECFKKLAEMVRKNLTVVIF